PASTGTSFGGVTGFGVDSGDEGAGSEGLAIGGAGGGAGIARHAKVPTPASSRTVARTRIVLPPFLRCGGGAGGGGGIGISGRRPSRCRRMSSASAEAV